MSDLREQNTSEVLPEQRGLWERASLAEVVALALWLALAALGLDRALTLPAWPRYAFLALFLTALLRGAVVKLLPRRRPAQAQPGPLATTTAAAPGPAAAPISRRQQKRLERQQRQQNAGALPTSKARLDGATASPDASTRAVHSATRPRAALLPAHLGELALAAAVIAVSLLFSFPHMDTPLLLQRFSQPWANLPWPGQTHIRLPGGLQRELYEGDDLIVTATLSGGRGDAALCQLHLRGAGPGRDGLLAMERISPGVYQARLPQLTRSCRFFVTAGDGGSATCTVQVSPRPHLALLAAQITAPKSTGLPPRLVVMGGRELAAPQGSQIELQLLCSIPIRDGKAITSAGPAAIQFDSSGRRGAFRFPLDADMGLQIRLLADSGAGNRPGLSYRFRTIADRAPRAQLSLDDSDNLAGRDQSITLHYQADDDYYLAQLVLLAKSLPGGVVRKLVLRSEEDRPRQIEAQVPMAISALAAEDAAAVELTLLALDGKGQRALSQPLTVQLAADPQQALLALAHLQQQYGQQLQRNAALLAEGAQRLEQLRGPYQQAAAAQRNSEEELLRPVPGPPGFPLNQNAETLRLLTAGGKPPAPLLEAFAQLSGQLAAVHCSDVLAEAPWPSALAAAQEAADRGLTVQCLIWARGLSAGPSYVHGLSALQKLPAGSPQFAQFQDTVNRDAAECAALADALDDLATQSRLQRLGLLLERFLRPQSEQRAAGAVEGTTISGGGENGDSLAAVALELKAMGPDRQRELGLSAAAASLTGAAAADKAAAAGQLAVAVAAGLEGKLEEKFRRYQQAYAPSRKLRWSLLSETALARLLATLSLGLRLEQSQPSSSDARVLLLGSLYEAMLTGNRQRMLDALEAADDLQRFSRQSDLLQRALALRSGLRRLEVDWALGQVTPGSTRFQQRWQELRLLLLGIVREHEGGGWSGLGLDGPLRSLALQSQPFQKWQAESAAQAPGFTAALSRVAKLLDELAQNLAPEVYQRQQQALWTLQGLLLTDMAGNLWAEAPRVDAQLVKIKADLARSQRLMGQLPGVAAAASDEPAAASGGPAARLAFALELQQRVACHALALERLLAVSQAAWAQEPGPEGAAELAALTALYASVQALGEQIWRETVAPQLPVGGSGLFDEAGALTSLVRCYSGLGEECRQLEQLLRRAARNGAGALAGDRELGQQLARAPGGQAACALAQQRMDEHQRVERAAAQVRNFAEKRLLLLTLARQYQQLPAYQEQLQWAGRTAVGILQGPLELGRGGSWRGVDGAALTRAAQAVEIARFLLPPREQSHGLWAQMHALLDGGTELLPRCAISAVDQLDPTSAQRLRGELQRWRQELLALLQTLQKQAPPLSESDDDAGTHGAAPAGSAPLPAAAAPVGAVADTADSAEQPVDGRVLALTQQWQDRLAWSHRQLWAERGQRLTPALEDPPGTLELGYLCARELALLRRALSVPAAWDQFLRWEQSAALQAGVVPEADAPGGKAHDQQPALPAAPAAGAP